METGEISSIRSLSFAYFSHACHTCFVFFGFFLEPSQNASDSNCIIEFLPDSGTGEDDVGRGQEYTDSVTASMCVVTLSCSFSLLSLVGFRLRDVSWRCGLTRECLVTCREYLDENVRSCVRETLAVSDVLHSSSVLTPCQTAVLLWTRTRRPRTFTCCSPLPVPSLSVFVSSSSPLLVVFT